MNKNCKKEISILQPHFIRQKVSIHFIVAVNKL